MEKVIPALDTDALRSFVTGIECGSFARAASLLCRSTSAVSAQLKKLEQQCGTELVMKQGRHLQLTPQGELLMSYARRLLAINDEALRAIKGELLSGEIRIGMQEDFGESLMPDILGQFKRHHPELRIFARVDRQQALSQGLQENDLDMALLWQSSRPHGELWMTECQLEWIYHPGFDPQYYLQQGVPLPLVMFESPCVMRRHAIDCLDNAGIAWRVVFVSHSLQGIRAAVQAGLGITVRSRLGMPESLQFGHPQLPSPGRLGMSLQRGGNIQENQTACDLLSRLIISSLSGHALSVSQ